MAYNVKLPSSELSEYKLLVVYLCKKIASLDLDNSKNVLKLSEMTLVLTGISGLLLFNVAGTIDNQETYKQYLYDKATSQELLQKYILMMKGSANEY